MTRHGSYGTYFYASRSQPSRSELVGSFHSYFYIWAAFITKITTAVGWLTIASMNGAEFGSSVHMPAAEWSRRMGRFYEVLDPPPVGGGQGAFSSEGLERYYHIQVHIKSIPSSLFRNSFRLIVFIIIRPGRDVL